MIYKYQYKKESNQGKLIICTNKQPVRLLISASPNQPANSVFLSQQTSIGQSKPAQKPTSEQAGCFFVLAPLVWLLATGKNNTA